MSVDVFTTYGPAGKLIKRPSSACPDWCDQDHNPRSDDGAHFSTPLGVELTTEQADQADYEGDGYCAVLVAVQWYPGESPFVMLTHHDGATSSEDKLTPGEADKVAWALEKNASIIRAQGDHTCWCDGMHTPDDWHWGERESVPLSLSTLPYVPEATTVIVREVDATATFVHQVSHNERDWDVLTPDEADQLAKHLRRCGALVAFHQAAQMLAEASR